MAQLRMSYGVLLVTDFGNSGDMRERLNEAVIVKRKVVPIITLSAGIDWVPLFYVS
jgi:transcriptional regulatory protein LevR